MLVPVTLLVAALGVVAVIISIAVGQQRLAAANVDRQVAELRREANVALDAVDRSHRQSDRDASDVGDYDTPATLRGQPNPN